MLDIEAMKRQHAEIRDAMNAAMNAIEKGPDDTDAEGLATRLAAIASKIDDHLKAEDEDVYPTLIESTRPEVRRVATQFHENMGGLADEFSSYFRRYGSRSAIDADPTLFTFETRRLFERMSYRMRREETDLYPLLGDTGSAAPH